MIGMAAWSQTKSCTNKLTGAAAWLAAWSQTKHWNRAHTAFI